MEKGYSFGAGGFKLGDRVEVLTTGQRGILTGETVHISGCNTYQVLLPNVNSDYSVKPAVKHYDYLILRKLDQNEAVFTQEENLPDEMVFSPKGMDVNAEWIKESVKAGKEPIPEIDESVGVEDIIHTPGTEVWHKVYGKPMLISYIYREIYEKELTYGLTYMIGDKQVSVCSHHYALIPLCVRIKINHGGEAKWGPLFSDSFIEIENDISIEDFAWAENES